MVSEPKEYGDSLSLLGWSITLSKAAAITFGLLIKAAIGVLRSRNSGLTFYQYIAYKGMRDYQSGLKAVEIQNLLPSTSKTCRKFARKHSIEQSAIELPDGTVAHWLGPRKASNVVVFFHGGGYMSPILSAHLSLAFGFSKPSDRDVCVVVLPYVLASENANRYPKQLQQAVFLIEHLLHSEKLSASAITLIGDSAGAHLVLSLILHLSHRNTLVSPLEMGGKFAGVVLISPWVTMNSSAESIQINRGKDILSAAALTYWAQNFLGGAAPDPWNTPLIAPKDWWPRILTDEVVVMYGDDELLRDDITKLCDKLKGSHSTTSVLKFPKEIHVNMVMNHFLRIKATCESEKAFTKWMDNHLRSEKVLPQ